ncbi:hypothetical protein [Pseudohalioglobus lutimaris]|uniref:Uncharacterized protein n=1 Tax=Pseudohalioglobus lutimaris TaxID=1737061 RepID=A0A2N5X4D6_9GAMM|nr:hypothetical protein [Pseudohalioglobus lutimaris]PLW69332.1 hypothetical protein C0039_07300 [Pseudohalioglobus lutimaris]
MFTWTKRLLLTVSFLALITANILTLTSAAFNTAVSGLLGTALGIRTVSGVMQTQLANQDRAIRKQAAVQTRRKAATRRFGSRLATRTRRVAAKSIAAIPAEAIPFIGIGVLIADTGYELYAACETITDLDQLYQELGMADEVPDDVMHTVCDPTLPDAAEIWDSVIRSKQP